MRNFILKEQDHPDINKNIHPPLVALFYIFIAYLLGWFAGIPSTIPGILKNMGFTLVIISTSR
ncbi:MAG TPA: hypothetical protein VMN99_04035, partial [Anaerolineales bacterium]|nr:hypothetical protein [Anaerolineales bacterium]